MPKGIYKRREGLVSNAKGKHWKLSEQARKNISNGHKGKTTLLKGKKRSLESRLKQSKTLKGHKISDETKQKIGLGNLGKKHSEENNLKMSLARKGKPSPLRGRKFPERCGENHFAYIKDRTQLKKSENKMNDYAYKIWMLKIRKQDNWKCRLLSDECKGRLESHHIFNWIDYPELRYVLKNGITLCHFHHPRGREEEKRMIPIFQELLSVSEE